MIHPAKKNGLWGEIAAARHYREQGYTIVDGNYRTRLGEVDVIAARDDVLVFCEVKTRGSHAKALPRESVTHQKQRRVVAAALQYVKQRHYTGKIRFDVAEVLIAEDGGMTVTLLEDCFNGNDVNQFGL